MAAPRPVFNRSVQREETGGSVDSSATTRTPVPAVSPGSLEGIVSPAQVAEPPEKNLWEQICEEYEAEIPTLPEGYKVKQEAAVRVSSVTPLEELVPHGFNVEHYLPVHPFPVVPPVPCPPKKAETVEPKTCSPKDYLEMFIFPVLLPGMANLLHQAKRERCFERKRTKFIACDFLTEWLYNQNPKRAGEPFTEFFSIPFVEEWLTHQSLYMLDNKRLPSRAAAPPTGHKLQLNLCEFEASLIYSESQAVQRYMVRPHLKEMEVRCDPEIQELRQWQKKLREDKYIRQRVKVFWAKQEQKLKCKMDNEEVSAASVPPP